LLLPLAALYGTVPERLIALVGNDPASIAYGADYLRVVAIGVPFAGLNLIGSRALVGADDAWTPMMLRAGGAVVNVTINAVLIFGLELGVVGAAIGTVVANVLVLAAFVTGFTVGRLPLIGEFPITIDVAWPRPTIGELRTVQISERRSSSRTSPGERRSFRCSRSSPSSDRTCSPPTSSLAVSGI